MLIVSGPDIEPVILTQNLELSRLASEDNRLAPAIASGNCHELQDWQIVRKSSTAYAGERVMYDCLAVKERGEWPESQGVVIRLIICLLGIKKL